MDDRDLLAALVAGEPSGLEGAYCAYADRVYTLCHWLLDDVDAAADACHDAFVVASQRAYRLPDPDQLPDWLVALGRNECLRRLRGPDRRAARTQPEPDQLLPVPPLVWPRLQIYCFDPDVAPERDTIVRRAGRLDPRTGFPRPWRARRRRLAVVGVVALAVVVLAAGAGAALRPDDPGRAVGTLGATGSGAPPAPPSGSPTPSPTSTPTPSPTPSPTPPPPPPPVRPSPSPTAPPATSPPPLAVDADGEIDCVAGGLFGYRLEVSATGSEPFDTAQLHVATGGGTEVYDMAIDGRAASATSDLMASPELEWWVEATGGGGRSAETTPTEVTQPCPG